MVSQSLFEPITTPTVTGAPGAAVWAGKAAEVAEVEVM
jgi:hypothetical protein